MIFRAAPSLPFIVLGVVQMLPPNLSTGVAGTSPARDAVDAVLTELSDFVNASNPCDGANLTGFNEESNCSQTALAEDPEFKAFQAVTYPSLIVFMSIAMVVSILTNSLVLFSAQYIRKITPTVFFSLSLVAANAYAIIVLAFSLTINTFLKFYMKWEPNLCWALLLEVFRMTGLSVSALHLLALAINHYVGILRPLHYASTVTKRRLTLVIIALWVIPFIVYLILFLDRPENNFYQLHCGIEFMKQMPFRLTVSILFFVPLIIMTVLYIHIFITVKRNHSGFLMGQKNHAGNQHIKRNLKAVVTTLLILGTYLIGYMPAVVFYVLTCNECPCPLSKLSQRTRYMFGVLNISLFFVKCLSDPIIYTIRLPEVRNGVRRMWLTRCCSKYLPEAQPGSCRKRTVTSLRSDVIPLNCRNVQDRSGDEQEPYAHNGSHLCAKTSLNSAAQTETALA